MEKLADLSFHKYSVSLTCFSNGLCKLSSVITDSSFDIVLIDLHVHGHLISLCLFNVLL